MYKQKDETYKRENIQKFDESKLDELEEQIEEMIQKKYDMVGNAKKLQKECNELFKICKQLKKPEEK